MSKSILFMVYRLQFVCPKFVFGGNSGGPVVVRKGTLNADSMALSDTFLIGIVSGSAYTDAICEDESSSDVMQNADLVHAVTVDTIHAAIRHYYLSKKER